MDLKEELKWLHSEIDKLEDPKFIEALKNILKNNRKESNKRISIRQYNTEIDNSISQIESGQTLSHQQVEENLKKWGKE
jgi:predicted NAD/FAD-binding protein